MNGMFVSHFFTVYPARFILREWLGFVLSQLRSQLEGIQFQGTKKIHQCNAAPCTPPSAVFLQFGALLQICDKTWICGKIHFDFGVRTTPNTEPAPDLTCWAVSKPCHAGAHVGLMRGLWWFGTRCMGILWKGINKCRAPAVCPQVTAAGPSRPPKRLMEMLCLTAYSAFDFDQTKASETSRTW